MHVALIHGPDRLVRGGVPQATIIHACDGKALARLTLAVAEHCVHFAKIIWMGPRAVVVDQLERSEHMAAGPVSRAGPEQPLVIHRSGGGRELIGNLVEITHMHGADRSEVALGGEIGTFGEIDSGGEFWNEETQIRVTLPMRLGA